jgi:hypothetical protein
LPQKLKYTIKYINKLTTKYGEKSLMEIAIILLNQNVKYSIFLPDRFVRMPKPQIDILVCNPDITSCTRAKKQMGTIRLFLQHNK